MHRTLSDFGGARVTVLLSAPIAFIFLAIAGPFGEVTSAASDQPSTSAMPLAEVLVHAPSTVGSFKRPPSLPEQNPDAGTLRTYASRIGLYFGSMEDTVEGSGQKASWVRTTLSSEFNLLEPGNPLKWWMIEPRQDVFDFGPGDLLVDFAITHQMKVRGHNLLWGMANPDWLVKIMRAKSGQQLEGILIHHIRTVMGHYRDKYPGVVKWWDVTNEVMGWNNKFNSDGILWTSIGTNPDRADYLRVAFRTARATDPNAILCMNDWGNEGSGSDRTKNMIDIVKAFRAEGIPIDCAGMEAHLNSESAPTYKQVMDAMKAYADLGVQVQVTEFDIQAPRSAPDWNKASAIAADVLKACVDSANCTAFNNWGYSQAFGLNDAGNPNTVTMLPWDVKNQKSPEYLAMRAVLESGAH